MSGRSRWAKAAGWAVVQWVLTTVVIRFVGLVVDEFRSWPTCGAFAAASVVTGELSDRWHRRRRRDEATRSSGSVTTRG